MTTWQRTSTWRKVTTRHTSSSRRRSMGWLLRWTLGTAVALACWLPSAASAKRPYMAAEPFTGKKVRVDGQLRDWPRGFERLDVQEQGGQPTPAKALVGYDAQYLYVAAEVEDQTVARTSRAGSTEDHLTLFLYFPSLSGAQGTTYRVEIYPGDPGKLPALVKLNGGNAPGAQAVEAPSQRGLTVEARIPWRAFPEASKIRVGLRAKLSYTDASAPGRVGSVVSTSSKSGADMPRLTLQSETALFQALIEPKRLPSDPAKAAFGDLTGQGGVEMVAVYGHFLSIVGPGYKGGNQFYFNELTVSSADRVRLLETRDLSGDGKDEIILRERIGPDDAYRELVEVLSIGADGAPQRVFAHEVALVSQKGRIENEFSIEGSGADTKLVVAQGKAEGFEPGSFDEPQIGGGVQPALLPWQTVGARVFSWKGQGMALAEEKSWTPRVSGGSPRAAGPSTPQPPAPRPPSADEMLERVYALYRQDRGLDHSPPNFDFVTDVAEDGTMERVLVHGKDLVVFGKGFKEGRSYTYLTIGVREAKDILSISTRDLVGDGKAEIIVHALLNAQASEELGGEIVQRQALFIYKVLGDQVTRIFAAETGRALGDNRILGSIAFLPEGARMRLELRPLRALGWTAASYPFPQDQTTAGGLEPLLLPWGSMEPRTYRFDGSKFTLQ